MFKPSFLSALGTGLGLGAAAIATLMGVEAYESGKEVLGRTIENRKTNMLERSPAIQAWYAEREKRMALEHAAGISQVQQAA